MVTNGYPPDLHPPVIGCHRLPALLILTDYWLPAVTKKSKIQNKVNMKKLDVATQNDNINTVMLFNDIISSTYLNNISSLLRNVREQITRISPIQNSADLIISRSNYLIFGGQKLPFFSIYLGPYSEINFEIVFKNSNRRAKFDLLFEKLNFSHLKFVTKSW